MNNELIRLVKQQNEENAAFIKRSDEERDALKKQMDSLGREIDVMQKRAGRPSYTSTPDEQTEARAAHRKAFSSYLRTARGGEQLAEFQTKAMSIGVDADGGYAVPEDTDRSIGAFERNASPMLSEVEVAPVANEKYEKLYSAGVQDSGWVSETAARPATGSPQILRAAPLFGEIYANMFTTQRVLDDAFFDIEAWLAQGAGERFGEQINTECTTGAGVAGTSPRGFLSYTASAAPAWGEILLSKSGIAGGIDTNMLMDVPDSLKPGYRKNAKWMMSSATARVIRKLKDSTGQYLWQPGLKDGEPSTLLGHAVVINEDMPAPGAGAKAIAFADWKRFYKIALIGGVSILRDPFTAKPNVAFYVRRRLGGGVMDSRAGVLHQLAV